MDKKLKNQIKYIKASKPESIPQRHYGTNMGSLILITNSYVKKFKRELKREYRAAKRSEKQRARREMIAETT